MNTLNELREVVAESKRENNQALAEARRTRRGVAPKATEDDENHDDHPSQRQEIEERDPMDMTLAEVEQWESQKRPRAQVRRGNMADLAAATYAKELQLVQADDEGYTQQITSGETSVEDQLRALEAQPLAQVVEEMAKSVAEADRKRKSNKTTGYSKNDRFNEKLDKMLG